MVERRRVFGGANLRRRMSNLRRRPGADEGLEALAIEPATVEIDPIGPCKPGRCADGAVAQHVPSHWPALAGGPRQVGRVDLRWLVGPVREVMVKRHRSFRYVGASGSPGEAPTSWSSVDAVLRTGRTVRSHWLLGL